MSGTAITKRRSKKSGRVKALTYIRLYPCAYYQLQQMSNPGIGNIAQFIEAVIN
ncbi:MAG: hypothetical protein IAF38_10410 [Bacteroidia bacterium]|nr:hypothetical protein [Bacteroidia bacterium]